MDERQKMLQRKKEDLRFVQGCICVVVAVLLEMFLFQVRDYYIPLVGDIQKIAFIQDCIYFLFSTSRIVILAGIGWMIYSFSTGKHDIFYPIALFLGGLVLYAYCYGILYYGEKGVNILMFLVPAWCGLALIFFLYQVEFFLSAFFTGLAGVGLWLCGQTTLVSEAGQSLDKKQLTFYVFLNTTMVVIIGGFILINKAYRKGGILPIGKQELTLISDMKDSSSLWLVGLTGVISLVVLAVAVTFGYTVIYFCTMALAGWLFVLLIYFTVKMM